MMGNSLSSWKGTFLDEKSLDLNVLMFQNIVTLLLSLAMLGAEGYSARNSSELGIQLIKVL